MLNITVFYHVNSSSVPFSDIRTAKKLPRTIFPDYLPLCIIVLKFHCLFAQFWYTANSGLIWHLSTLFQMSHIHFHKFQVILNKMIPILFCYTAMHAISILEPFCRVICSIIQLNTSTTIDPDGMKDWDGLEGQVAVALASCLGRAWC